MADWRIVTPTRIPEDDELGEPLVPSRLWLILECSAGDVQYQSRSATVKYLRVRLLYKEPAEIYDYNFVNKRWEDTSGTPVDITTVDLTFPEAAVLAGSKMPYCDLIAFEKGTTACKLAVANEAKTLIRNALINKGVDVPDTTPFRQYAGKVGEIQNGGSRITSISVLTGGGPNQTFQVKFPVSVFSGATEYTPNKGIILGSVSEVTFTCDCELSELLTSPGILYQFFKNSGSLPDPTVNITISVSGEALKVDGSAA